MGTFPVSWGTNHLHRPLTTLSGYRILSKTENKTTLDEVIAVHAVHCMKQKWQMSSLVLVSANNTLCTAGKANLYPYLHLHFLI